MKQVLWQVLVFASFANAAVRVRDDDIGQSHRRDLTVGIDLFGIRPHQHSALPGQQLLRRERIQDDGKVVAESSRTVAKSHWQMLSAGDVQAITLDEDTIYAVGTDKLAVLEKGIFKQSLHEMTPYSNWTLIGYGSHSSIAVHSSVRGKIMYGVGNNSWLYKQELATMARNNVWTLASVFPLTAIAISGDIVYGVSPDHPNELYSESLLVRGPQAVFHGWTKAGTGQVKSLSVVHGVIFAVFSNDKIYNKLLSGAADNYIEREWAVDPKNEPSMLSIGVVGDTIYGVSADHRVYRKPSMINEKWGLTAKGSMRSVAIDASGTAIYGASPDGKVWKQDLVRLNPSTGWVLVSENANVLSLTIQGDTIYGLGSDSKVYKQKLSLMRLDTEWLQSSGCCVSQIAAADGIIYGIGEDQRIYRQADALMTPDSKWIPASKAGVFLIAIRGDTIFSVNHKSRMTYEQPLSRMTIYSQWKPSRMEDALYPSKKYLSIMAHNDVMYACGEDMNIYTKFIDKPITYPPGLFARGNTHEQAMYWNLTDLPGAPTPDEPTAPPSTTPEWEATTTTVRHKASGGSTSGTSGSKTSVSGVPDSEKGTAIATENGATTTTVESGATTTTVSQVKDCYSDLARKNCDSGRSHAHRSGWQFTALSLAIICLLSRH